MAVYTDVAAEELAEFLKSYDIGELLSYKGIAEGVENSNFLMHTSKGAYILTLYEKRVAEGDLPYFLSLMAHLAGHGVSCPQPARSRSGAVCSTLAGRPAAIINFLEGMWPRRPNAAHCAGVGEALATGGPSWPWATFLVNIAGAFALGYFITRLQERLPQSAYRRPLLGTGLCGALTTFSTMQVELIDMLDAHRYAIAGTYAVVSIASGYGAMMLSTAYVRRAGVLA
jgi:protein CrcB